MYEKDMSICHVISTYWSVLPHDEWNVQSKHCKETKIKDKEL